MTWFRGRWLLKLAAILLAPPPTHMILLSHQVVPLAVSQPCKHFMAALWELAQTSVCGKILWNDLFIANLRFKGVVFAPPPPIVACTA